MDLPPGGEVIAHAEYLMILIMDLAFVGLRFRFRGYLGLLGI